MVATTNVLALRFISHEYGDKAYENTPLLSTVIVTKCVAARALNASRPPSSESAVAVVDLLARTEKKQKIERVKPMKII